MKKNVTTKSIHQQLQEIATKELENLPQLLERLEPKERLRAVLNLLPYTAPRVESCQVDFGEGWSTDI